MGLGKMLTGLFKKDGDNYDEKNKIEDNSSVRMNKTEFADSPVSGQSATGTGGHGEDQGQGENKITEGVSEPESAAGKASENDGAGAELTEEKILSVLSEVYDPEIPIDIVNLGLIYGIEIEGGNVRINMTMTAPGCPASTQIAGESKILVEEIPGVEFCEIEIVWDPPWDPSKMSEEAQQSLGMF
ncbi:MAG: iron-sulfur cluster assembly protein [Deltaproteobacteria bacterium]